MKKHIGISLFFMGCFLSLSATNYFVATNGDDSNAGTLDKPFATLQKAQSKVVPGDTVYIRGGEYRIREEQMMGGDHLRAYVFEMNKSGTQAKRICYTGYQDERPIFNLAEVKPEGKRVSVFYVSGSYLHFRNFEIIKTQVTIREHTQSECIYNQGGNHNIYENLAMHDGMAIGFYLVRGSHNLVLNCDAYNNFDPVSENGTGGNVDGFGGHPASASYTGNVFKGCRAWYNSDDGFDLIKAQAAYSPGEIVDVDGYDHIIRNNLSYKPRAAGKHIVDVNREECTIINNSFLPVDMTVGEDDFVSLDPAQLTLPRKADGSLPDIDFLKLKRNSKLYDAGIGFQFSAQNL